MTHLQNTVPDWTQAIEGDFPFVVKAIDGGEKLKTAKQHNPNCITVLRHHFDSGQVFGGNWADNVIRARHFFSTFIDKTFREQYAQYTDYIEEFNEYLANSQNETEIADRLAWAEAAAWVWAVEYRIQPDYSHIRLVLCNAAIGNWIDWRFAEIAESYNCVLGYHPYTLWQNSERWDGDWLNLSGLFAIMEEEWGGYTPTWLFTEAGPFEAAEDGWRSSKCLGGDRDKYVEAMRQWIRDVRTTPAFQDGRILGFVTFTTGGGEKWRSFETRQPELNMLREMYLEEWWQPQPIPVPVPPPPTPECQPMLVVGRYGLNIRADSIITAKRVGYLFKGSWFIPDERRVIGSDIWVRAGGLGWLAQLHNGVTYLVPFGVEQDQSRDE